MRSGHKDMANPTDNLGPQFQLDLNPDRRRQFLAECNSTLALARENAVNDCVQKGGFEGCRLYSLAIDALLQSCYRWLAQQARLDEAEYGRIALVAQGGYGRAEQNPHSDIDLLFLMPDSPTPAEQAFVRSFLYLLWDMNKLDVGHATKGIREALSAAGTDIESTTALTRTRLVAGNPRLLAELDAALATLLRGPQEKWFVSSVLASLKLRREKFGSSVYMLEPNVKEGEGALRDVHTIEWLSYALLDSSSMDTLIRQDILAQNQLDSVIRAADFLLRVRTLLHQIDGRKVDVLSFDKQPAIARTLGFQSDAVLLAEERLMKEYYQHARAIDRYMQKAARILTSRASTFIDGLLNVVRRRNVDRTYWLKTGVLFMKKPSPEFFRRDPPRVMECFLTASACGSVLSDELKDLLAAANCTDTEDFRTSPRCRDAFMKILGRGRNAALTLREMQETGILAHYMPEFRKLFCLARIDHYHRYTVDEHLIRTVEILEDLLDDATTATPELARAAREIRRPDLLALSLLLHDIGKGEGHGHVLRGAILAQKITQRMGLPHDEQETVRQLVLLHVKMVHVSQRRDLDDPNVIAEMARAVPDADLLRKLYILTYCDTQGVGPGTWTDWKAALLHDLYRKTLLFLEGRDPLAPMDAQTHERLATKLLRAAGEPYTRNDIDKFLDNAPPKYINSIPPAKMAKHMRMLRELTPENRIVWQLEEPEGLNYTEIITVSYDVPGLMSNICGALASKDVNILSVQVFSTNDGYAIDVFQVTDLRGNRLPQAFHLDRLRQDLNKVLLGAAPASDVFRMRRRKWKIRADLSIVKPTQILFDNDSSASHTIVEVKTHDRPGLLYDITSVCAAQQYYIHMAMITTEAYRVVDVFYITDLDFNKLEPGQMKKLKTALEQVLNTAKPDTPAA